MRRWRRDLVGHYQRRWSWAARWCERIAFICVPYFALAILLHRFGHVSSDQVVWLLAIGLVLIATSLIFGVRALFDLWNGGYRGGRATIRGVILSVLMLTPFVWYGYLAVEHPPVYDVATDPFDPPQLRATLAERENAEANPLAEYDTEYAVVIVAEYPALGSRRYEAGAERIAAAVETLVADYGWRRVGAPVEAAEAEAAPETLIEAVASTPLLGFNSDVAVRIASEAEASVVDIRSVSRFGAHDFGYNAALIEAFLADLDKALIGIAGEG